MDDLDGVCPYCETDCSYPGFGNHIEFIIELLIPARSTSRRFIEINIIDWIVSAKVWEDITLVGEIVVNNWFDPEEDFTVTNYFIDTALSFRQEEYINKFMTELRMYYDWTELHDGEHPILVKIKINYKKDVK